MPGELTLRPAEQADEPAVRELVFRVLHEYGLEPSPEDTDADLFDLHGHYAAKGGWFVVLLEDDRLIGTAGLAALGNGVCELRKMYLDPTVRGRGLGKLLLNAAITKARELQFHTITLETASVLKEAVRLYEKAGFRPVPAQHLAARCDTFLSLSLGDHPAA